ncbi:hypothetical protein HDU96_007097 [Phlyctochytrium bullatum]|nr:hypothetical protein HDU96_007097 [Phlyctochytrium bullatum]
MTKFSHLVIITGAAKGIGRGVACDLASHCDSSQLALALLDHPSRKSDLQTVCDKLRTEHSFSSAHPFLCDLQHPGSAKKLIDEITSHFDGSAITGLVNNAAVYACAPIEKVDEEEFERVFRTNVGAVVCLTAAAVPKMREGACVVNVSTAITHCPDPHHALYIASKGAVEALTRALAVELAPKRIRVNTASPGFTDTDMLPEERCEHAKQVTPFGRIGKVEDITPVVRFLLDEKSNWVTGQNIIASGGYGYAL